MNLILNLKHALIPFRAKLHDKAQWWILQKLVNKLESLW